MVELTEHTIESVEEKEDWIGSDNILISKTVDGVVIEGKLNFVDDSDEVLNIGVISEWVKITPHEKGSEVSLDIEMTTNSGKVYNGFKYEQAFLQHYEKEFDLSNGTGSFSFFVRNKDELDRTLGARIVPMLEEYVDDGEIDEFGADVGVVPVAMTTVENSSVQLYKIYADSNKYYSIYNVKLYSLDSVKIIIDGVTNPLYGFYYIETKITVNKVGHTIVSRNVLEQIVNIIGTSRNAIVPNGDTYSFYYLSTFGAIADSSSNYTYSFDGSKSPKELVFTNKNSNSVYRIEVADLDNLGWSSNYATSTVANDLSDLANNSSYTIGKTEDTLKFFLATATVEIGQSSQTTDFTEYYLAGYNPGYPKSERGAGYLQLTGGTKRGLVSGTDSQVEFLKSMRYSDSDISNITDIPAYIGVNYTSESSGYYWENKQKNWTAPDDTVTSGLGNYIDYHLSGNKGYDQKGVFLAFCYILNGLAPLNNLTTNEIEDMKKGNFRYDQNSNKIIVNSKSIIPPNHWSERSGALDVLNSINFYD